MKHPSTVSSALDPAGKTLPQLLLQRAASDADVLSHRHKKKGIWQGMSWAQFAARVRFYAGGLAAKGVVRGDTIGIIGENEPEHFIAELAAQSLGAICVPLYPDLTADEIGYALNHSEAMMIFAQDQEQVDKVLGSLDNLPLIRGVIYWDDKGMWSYNHPLLSDTTALAANGARWHAENPGKWETLVASAASTDTALLLFTSGTTGKPKAVVCSHAFLLDNAMRLKSGTAVGPGAEYLSYIPLAWLTEQALGLSLGLIAPLVVNFPERPESVVADLREIGVELVFFGSRQWESMASSVSSHMFDAGPLRRAIYQWGLNVGTATRIARLEGRPVGLWARLMEPLAEATVLKPLRDKLGIVRARASICAGSAMAPEAFRLFHAMGVPLRNAYAATEFGVVSIHQGDAFDVETAGPAVPIPNGFGGQIDWKFTDKGELLVKGGTGFTRYLKQADKTAERFEGEWFRTGDYCTVAPNGDLVFMDRLDDLKTLAGGETYPPQYIETRLRFSPFIREVMTVGDSARGHVAALVEIDGEIVSQWADERKIGFSTFADLSQRPEVRALVSGEIDKVNRLLPEHSRVRSFANFPKPLDPDEGELTRTRKLRRVFLAERYESLIEALYGPAGPLSLEIPIRYQDGKQGVLKCTVQIESGAGKPGARAKTGPKQAERLAVAS